MATARKDEGLRAPRAPERAAGHPLLGITRLQGTAGNAAVARLIQRKTLGPGKGGKTWMSSGNFDAKHLVESLDEDTAKARYTSRYNKGANVPSGNQVNTVVAEPDLKTAIADASKVAGDYPKQRGQRGKLTVTVNGMKVLGRKQGAKQVPDRVVTVSTLTVEGDATESLYTADHVAG